MPWELGMTTRKLWRAALKWRADQSVKSTEAYKPLLPR